MNKKRFLELLKNLQSIMRCPSCGAVYDVSEMQFMGANDGYFLLSMTCRECSLPVWVNFFAGGESKETLIAGDLTVTEAEVLTREPISGNEVIDFHLALKEFNGDFKKTFK